MKSKYKKVYRIDPRKLGRHNLVSEYRLHVCWRVRLRLFFVQILGIYILLYSKLSFPFLEWLHVEVANVVMETPTSCAKWLNQSWN